VVVLEVDQPRDIKGSSVNPHGTGGIFERGSDGRFCELVLDASEQDNWSARAATPSDVTKGEEVLFQAGSGRVP